MHSESFENVYRNNCVVLYSEYAAAKEAGIPPSTLRLWRRKGRVTFFQLTSGRIAYSKQTVAELKEIRAAA